MSEKIRLESPSLDIAKHLWEDAEREYEDQADRLAIRKLLPKRMSKFADVGGYGRFASEYLKHAHQVFVFDSSKTRAKQVKEVYGEKIEIKTGDFYKLPFKKDELDGVMMVRVAYQIEHLDKAIKEAYRVLKPGGVLILEIANKRTLPQMARFFTLRSKVNPFDKTVANYKEETDEVYNFHPKYAEDIFGKVGFKKEKVLSVSNFGNKSLKKVLRTSNLMKMEEKVQSAFAPIKFAPSIYYKLRKPEE